ncbi:MAG TPA: methyltransferase domain-containing protein [Vicinamibacteria bacterium]
MHKSSFQKMEAFRRKYLAGREDEPLRILDVGSQDVNGTYKPIFDAPAWTYRGLDMAPGRNVDIVLASPYRWREVPGASYDVVISGQALEHIEYFWITALEMSRVLRPGGLLCLIAPSGGFEHRYPVDCWRFYPDGFRALARWARLDVLDVFTEWEPAAYGDGSEAWRDTMMVCARPRRSPGAELWRRGADRALLAVLRAALRKDRASRGVAPLVRPV